MIEVTDMESEYAAIEDLVDELGENVLRDLRDTALTEEMPKIAASLAKMTPARAEAMIANIVHYLQNKEVVDATRILKLIEICNLGAAATFAEGGLFEEAPQA